MRTPRPPEKGELHAPVLRWLGSVVRGYFNYHAVPGNSDALQAFRKQVTRAWFWALRRRSQTARALTWTRMSSYEAR